MGLERVRVFVSGCGQFGNPLAIWPDAADLTDDECLKIAGQTGTSETVFVDNMNTGRIRIFVPTRRVPFAGHPLVGTAWWLAQTRRPPSALITDSGPVSVRATATAAWLTTAPFLGVPWLFSQLESEDDVVGADSAGAQRHDYVWAWRRGGQREIYARAFTSASGTVEDPATGSAAVDLCATLKQDLTIVQGAGSRIEVVYRGSTVELGGRCAFA